MRGQLEFIVIFGLIFLVVVIVAIMVRQPTTPDSLPSVLGTEESLLRDVTEQLIRNGADETLQLMELHGGYLTLDKIGPGAIVPTHTIFEGEGVPYWQVCQNDLSRSLADITRDYERGIQNYLIEHSSEITVPGKTVVVDTTKIMVDANILDNKIDLEIIVPISLQEYEAAERYSLSVPTEFGRLVQFSQALAGEFSTMRWLDWFTVYAILFSPDMDDGHPMLPTGGVMNDCGDGFTRTPKQVSAGLTLAANYVLSHLVWWGSSTPDSSEARSFAIPTVLGKTFSELEPQLFYSDDFSFKTTQGFSGSNSQILMDADIYVFARCTGVYNIRYAVTYPFVVRIFDKLSNYPYHIAGFVNVKDMETAPCSEPVSLVVSTACGEPVCPVNVSVTDHLGNPVIGALVTLGECFTATTNVHGTATGTASCGTQQIDVFADAYLPYISYADPAQPILVTLQSPVPHTVHFRTVAIEPKGSYTTCHVNTGDDPVIVRIGGEGSSAMTIFNLETETDCYTENPACVTCANADVLGSAIEQIKAACDACIDACITALPSVTYPSGKFNFNLPTGTFPVEATAIKYATSVLGGFITEGTIPATPDALTVTVPLAATAVPQLTEQELHDLAVKATNVCAIKPFKIGVPYPTWTFSFGQACTCSDLHAIATELATTGCLTASQAASIPESGCTLNDGINTIITLCDAQFVGSCGVSS